MPRKKKEIQVILQLPLEENEREFQRRVNEVYVDSMRFHLQKSDCLSQEKKAILQRIEKKYDEKSNPD